MRKITFWDSLKKHLPKLLLLKKKKKQQQQQQQQKKLTCLLLPQRFQKTLAQKSKHQKIYLNTSADN